MTAFYALSVHAHSTEQTDLKINVTEDGILLQSLSLQDSVEVFLFEVSHFITKKIIITKIKFACSS